MSACQQLQQEFMLHLILFLSVWCTTNSKIDCPYKNGADYIDGETEGKDITYGDCSFENTLCHYTPSCTNGTANNWTVLDGRAVCRGSGGAYYSFSVLLSPLLSITRNTSLVFNYTRSLPAKLSVFVATPTQIIQVFPEQVDNVSPQALAYINPSVVKIGFQARNANPGFNVTLSHVKLQAASSTDLPAHVTDIMTSRARDQSVASSTTQAEAKIQEVRSNVGIIVGVVVAVVVVVVVAGVAAGFFIWRRRMREQNRENEHNREKSNQNIYQNEGLAEIQNTEVEHSDVMTEQQQQQQQPRSHYDVMNFNASEDIHIYNSLHQ